VEDLRIELRGLEDRKQSHVELIDRAEAELKELNERFAKLTNALATAKDMVAIRPALRRDIPPLERALAALVEDIADKEQYIQRHKNIAQGVALLIKGFDMKLLKKLEAQEKVLQQAGL
jgi:predicted  nucleic acid-binding Zn-ribbon protein